MEREGGVAMLQLFESPSIGASDFFGGVGWLIDYDDDFEALRMARCRPQRVDHRRKAVGLVVGGNDDADSEVLGRFGELAPFGNLDGVVAKVSADLIDGGESHVSARSS